MMKKDALEKRGEWAAIGHMVLDGFWPVGAAYGTRFLPPAELLALASMIGGIFFFLVTLQKGQLKQVFQVRFLKGMLLYSACLLLPYVAIFYATHLSSAINAALLTQSEIVFAALAGYFFLKEQFTRNRWLGLCFIVLANIVVLYNGSIVFNRAYFILLFAPIVFVFGNALAKRLQAQGLGYAPLLLFRGLIGGALLLVFSSFVEGLKVPPFSTLGFLFFFGFFAFGLPKLLWQIALNAIDLSKVTAIALSYPVFSFLMAYLFLGEVPSLWQWVGLVAMFIGIGFLMNSKSRKIGELATQ